jgi:ubiquinone/menaquinone biosynthesis C-methylase UbiE
VLLAPVDPGVPNDEQIALWDGAGGDRWVAEADRYDGLNRTFSERIVAAAAPQEGEQVLDVGCGTGALARAVAPLVAPSGSVLGLDISGSMLDEARRRASRDGIANVAFEKGDAQVHPLPPAAFDLVLSRFGVMFFDDQLAAFSNLAAATRPGGRIVFTCWQDPGLQERKTVPAAAARPFLPDAAPLAVGLGHSLADREHTTALLRDAGFEQVEMSPCLEPQLIGPTVEDAAEFLRDAEVEAMFAGATRADIEAATTAIAAALESYLTAEGVELLGGAWLVTAVRAA